MREMGEGCKDSCLVHAGCQSRDNRSPGRCWAVRIRDSDTWFLFDCNDSHDNQIPRVVGQLHDDAQPFLAFGAVWRMLVIAMAATRVVCRSRCDQHTRVGAIDIRQFSQPFPGSQPDWGSWGFTGALKTLRR